MARIFIAWEMGDSLGHLARLSAIIHELLARGHQLFFALDDTTYLELFSFPQNVTVLPAPSAKKQLFEGEPAICNASILLKRGYGDSKQLAGLVRCWHGLFSLAEPDLYLFDYAPTAMLAARGAVKPKVIASSGFGSLVPGKPDIELAPWRENSQSLLARHEAMVVESINSVCDRFHYQRVRYLSDIYHCDLSLISCLPELDEYRRDPARTIYWGFRPVATTFPEPRWAKNDKRKVFAYLKAHLPQSTLVLDVLADSDLEVICYGAGFDSAAADRYRSRGLHLYLEPVSLTDLLPRADLVVCHAGKELVSQSLRSGVPLLMLPGQVEQHNCAQVIEKLGAGLMVPWQAGRDSIGSRLAELLLDPAYRQAAQLLAKKHLSCDTNEERLSAICDRLEALLDPSAGQQE